MPWRGGERAYDGVAVSVRMLERISSQAEMLFYAMLSRWIPTPRARAFDMPFVTQRKRRFFSSREDIRRAPMPVMISFPPLMPCAYFSSTPQRFYGCYASRKDALVILVVRRVIHSRFWRLLKILLPAPARFVILHLPAHTEIIFHHITSPFLIRFFRLMTPMRLPTPLIYFLPPNAHAARLRAMRHGYSITAPPSYSNAVFQQSRGKAAI